MWGTVEAGVVLDAQGPPRRSLGRGKREGPSRSVRTHQHFVDGRERSCCRPGGRCQGGWCAGAGCWAWGGVPADPEPVVGRVLVVLGRGPESGPRVVARICVCCCRRDGVEQIGSALLAFGDGQGHRSIAGTWLGYEKSVDGAHTGSRRFAAKAVFLAGQFLWRWPAGWTPSLGHIREGVPRLAKRWKLLVLSAGAAVRLVRSSGRNRWFFVSGVWRRLLSNTNSLSGE